MDTKILSDIGLSDREISVYITLVRLGATTTGPLVKASEIPSAKIYEILDKLIRKGIVTYVIKGKIKHFQASGPRTLLNFFDERKVALETLVRHLELTKKDKLGNQATVYEGIKSIRAAFYELFEYIGKNSEYCVFPIGEQLGTKELIKFWAQVFHKRVEMKIKVRTLPSIKWHRIFENFYSEYKLFEIRYVKQQFPTGVFIFKDHVLNILWEEKPIAFLIRSSENYSTWQEFFEKQWAKGKSL